MLCRLNILHIVPSERLFFADPSFLGNFGLWRALCEIFDKIPNRWIKLVPKSNGNSSVQFGIQCAVRIF